MQELETYRKEMEQELGNILAYWARYAVDERNGGFFGKIGDDNQIYPTAPKGSVLNSRILWTFSAAFNHAKNRDCLAIADRAFNYISNYFIDPEFGGVYWTVDFTGKPLDTKKQVYAIAFALYACSEYYKCTGKATVLQLAIQLFRVIVERSFDPVNGGYLEAFSRNWLPIDDLRLSEKDANAKKTMNTHLHVLEAFANLYGCWKDEQLKQYIGKLIGNFLDHMVDGETHHLRLFFDENWKVKPDKISYGHDIEAAWLLQEAAARIDDEQLLARIKNVGVQMAAAAAGGLDHDGGLWYEYNSSENRLVKEKHWWVQAEAMVGFFNAWQVTGIQNYLRHSQNSWKFIKEYILDKKNGEWFWGIREDHSPMPGEDKAGMWKCPYHNGRACIEIIHRIAAAGDIEVR